MRQRRLCVRNSDDAFMIEWRSQRERREERVESAALLSLHLRRERGYAKEGWLMKDVMSPCPWQSAKTMTAGPLAVKISPSPLQGLSSALLLMRYYARSSKKEICSISGPLNTGLFITRMGSASAFLEIKRLRKQCHNCLIAREPAAGGLMTYGSSDPPSASCSEDGWKEK